MRRFTLTLAMVAIVAFAFGQKSTNMMKISNEKFSGKQIMTYSGDKSTDALVIAWEEDFADSSTTGVNGMPDYFDYTTQGAVFEDQWQWREYSSGTNIGIAWTSDHQIPKEEFVVNVPVAVPSNNPGLYIEFIQSYYWSVTNGGNDSLEITYSIDDGASWVRIWATDDPALVEASGMEVDWGNWDMQTARIPLPAETYGNPNFKLKFLYGGDEGNSTRIYNMKLVEMPAYDLSMESFIPHTFYYQDGNLDSARADGIYQQLPIAQKRNYEYFASAVKSYGAVQTNGINISNTYTDGSGTVVCQKDTAFMKSGSDFLSIYQKDTFEIEGFAAAEFANVVAGTYTFKGMLSHDSVAVDADSTNQEWSMEIEYAPNSYEGSGAVTYLSRNTDINGQISPSNYGGASGDQIGISFTVSESCSVTGGLIPMGTCTDNAGFLIAVYLHQDVNDPNDWVQIGFSQDHYCTDAESNTTIDMDLQNDVELEPGKEYVMMAIPSWTAGSSEVNFANFDAYKGRENGLALYASKLHLGTSWYVIYNVPSFTVKLRNNQTINVETTLEENVKVYPNPTNGTLHIDNVNGATVEVYNMVGIMVDVINNASDFNTVDLSNYAEGTYLVKVYTEAGVVIKKVNLVK